MVEIEVEVLTNMQGKLMWLEETTSSGMVPEDESTSRMELVDNDEHL
jgi:hypothetical protein